jgi:hypothetical protein
MVHCPIEDPVCDIPVKKKRKKEKLRLTQESKQQGRRRQRVPCSKQGHRISVLCSLAYHMAGSTAAACEPAHVNTLLLFVSGYVLGSSLSTHPAATPSCFLLALLITVVKLTGVAETTGQNSRKCPFPLHTSTFVVLQIYHNHRRRRCCNHCKYIYFSPFLMITLISVNGIIIIVQLRWLCRYSDRLRAVWPGFDSQEGQVIFLYPTASRPTLELIKPSIQ